MNLDSIDKTRFVLDNNLYFHRETDEFSDDTNTLVETENGIEIYPKGVKIDSSKYILSSDEIESLLSWISLNKSSVSNFHRDCLTYPVTGSHRLYQDENVIDKSIRCLDYSAIPETCSCGNELDEFAKLHVKLLIHPHEYRFTFKLEVEDVLCLECSNPELEASDFNHVDHTEETKKYWDYIEKDLILTYSTVQTSDSNSEKEFDLSEEYNSVEEGIVLDNLENINRRWFSKNTDHNISPNTIQDVMIEFSKDECTICGTQEDELDSDLHLRHITTYKDTVRKEDNLKFQNIVPVCESCHSKSKSRATIAEMRDQLPIYVRYIKENSSLELDRDTVLEIASESQFRKEELDKYKDEVITSDCEILDHSLFDLKTQ